MIKDKEYPATHSMSTAWYMVDPDGNIGLMSFDDNGPVPNYDHILPDLDISDLAFGPGIFVNEICGKIHLNEVQIKELLGESKKANEVENWFDIFMEVSPAFTSEFLTLCKNNDISLYGCISPEMNIFCVNGYKCVDDRDNIIEGSTLDIMIKANIIKAFYPMTELYVNSEYDPATKSVVFTKTFDNSPYYVYCQPYWIECLQHRMNIPSTPVKITQVDEVLHDKLLHIPVRFKDMENIQIAQWFPCDSYAKKLAIDNAEYALLPTDEYTHKYCLSTPFVIDFYEYCPNKNEYKCTKCCPECASTIKTIYSLKPTILYVKAPNNEEEVINSLYLPQEIKNKIALISYIPKFPYKKSDCWLSINSVNQLMTDEVLTTLLSSSRAWFEGMVGLINPLVIIIENEALSVFTSVFPIKENEVLINNTKYPIFKESVVEENSKQIIALAERPYRGKIFKQTYTEQEVNNMKRDGKCFEIE